MEKIKKAFGGIKMTWLRVIIISVIAAVYTALMMILPLKNTSFQDIGIYPDAWVLLAVFIVINCGKFWEAGLKCFVFFLISQPLIYLLQVPFSPVGWQIFNYYGYWFKITLLTLPGGMVAFLLKKKNYLSVAVLSVANAIIAILLSEYAIMLKNHFPHHLLSVIFCILLPFFLIFTLFDEPKHKIVASIFFVSFAATGLIIKL